MVDLKTTYLGLNLKNPLIASSSPLTQKLDTAIQLEEAGVSAIVLHSLFEEQIRMESLTLHEDLSRGIDSFAEALDYFPKFGEYSIGPDKYINNLNTIKKSMNIPVLGSLNGISPGGWVQYAQKIEAAGADALELNLYSVASDLELISAELEDQHVRLVSDIRSQVKIPIAVKLSPFYTALPNFALRLSEAGVNGLVLFNRFYQPDLDLEELEVVPNLVLSTSHELRMPLRWIAILNNRIKVDLALTSGVHNEIDLLKAIMAGACAVTVTSEFLINGIQRASEILSSLETWMLDHEYYSIFQMKGSMSQQSVAEPGKFERANYMKVLSSYHQ